MKKLALISLITLASPIIANAGGWKTRVTNDFTSTSNFTGWDFNVQALPTDYLIKDGYLELKMLQTDKGGRVLSPPFQIEGTIKITIKHYMHQGDSNYPYYPSISLHDEHPLNYIAIDFQNLAAASYSINCSDADTPKIWNTTNNCVPKKFQSAITSSSLYDKWITTIIEYNPQNGVFKVDYDNDKKIDFNGVLKKQLRFIPTHVYFSTYGWYTGHFHRIDFVKVESVN